MDYGLITMALAAISLGIVAFIAIAVINGGAPVLVRLGHSEPQLPAVMGNRYAAFAISIFAAIIYGDFVVVAFLFYGFAALGVWDSLIYWSAGKPFVTHALAGSGSLVVAVLATVSVGS
ncbi:MAG: hypothetical protein AAGJ34_05195 [Pseudomonadota bacterium]